MESTTYEVNLLLGRLCIQLISEVPLSVTDEIRTFCTDTGQADITVYVRVMKQKFRLPKQMVGEDLLLEYYYDNGRFLAAAKRGTKESAAVTVYTPDFSEAVFYINEAEFPGMIRRVSKILQLFPIRQALAGYDAMILHSSRIIAGGNAIIFTAPSQTGKTTQAQLWKQYEDAEIVSNDRTLIQKDKGIFYTMGYPVDGSSPVYSNRKFPIGAFAVLRQGNKNRSEKLYGTISAEIFDGTDCCRCMECSGNGNPTESVAGSAGEVSGLSADMYAGSQGCFLLKRPISERWGGYRMASIKDRLYKQATKERVPLTGAFELSPLCNFSCRMCYVRRTRGGSRKSGRSKNFGILAGCCEAGERGRYNISASDRR